MVMAAPFAWLITLPKGSLWGAKLTITDAAGAVTERWVSGGRPCRG